MFKELAPVLRHRAVLMTITSIEEDQIRVTVVPKKLKDDENNALTTPVTVTGTAEELDAELGSTLVNFVGTHLQLRNTLERAKAEMDAAAKAAQAEARSKSKTAGKKDAEPASSAKQKDEVKSAESPKPTTPKTASLFDMPEPAESAEPVVIETVAPEEETDEDILAEIQANETSDEFEDAA